MFMSELLPPSSPAESLVLAQGEGELQCPCTSSAVRAGHLLCLEPHELISYWDPPSRGAQRWGVWEMWKLWGRGFQLVLPVWESVSPSSHSHHPSVAPSSLSSTSFALFPLPKRLRDSRCLSICLCVQNNPFFKFLYELTFVQWCISPWGEPLCQD